MFGLGAGEILLILIIALIVLGPAKLPEIAKSLGKGLREFRKATTDFQRQINEETDDVERRVRPAPPRPSAATVTPQPSPDAPESSGGAPPAPSTAEPVEVDRPGPPLTPRVVAAKDAIPRSPVATPSADVKSPAEPDPE